MSRYPGITGTADAVADFYFIVPLECSLFNQAELPQLFKQKRTFAASQISGFNSPELPKKRPCIPPPIPEVAAIEVF